MARYLVLFVADDADDGHADALRDVARRVGGAGFFDDPMGGAQRTVGTYLRVDDEAAHPSARALVGHVAVVSEVLAARVEVQLEERVLGHLVAGQADARLARALEAAFGR
ncbi:MAG: hypothetical protein HZB46_09830 [Solirubrobacterales bacterium]|nr:hypothetical protein [Solirubrobacterales bacterium]